MKKIGTFLFVLLLAFTTSLSPLITLAADDFVPSSSGGGKVEKLDDGYAFSTDSGGNYAVISASTYYVNQIKIKFKIDNDMPINREDWVNIGFTDTEGGGGPAMGILIRRSKEGNIILSGYGLSETDHTIVNTLWKFDFNAEHTFEVKFNGTTNLLYLDGVQLTSATGTTGIEDLVGTEIHELGEKLYVVFASSKGTPHFAGVSVTDGKKYDPNDNTTAPVATNTKSSGTDNTDSSNTEPTDGESTQSGDSTTSTKAGASNTTSSTTSSKNDDDNSKSNVWIWVVAGIVLVAGAGLACYYFLVYKKKNASGIDDISDNDNSNFNE